MDPKHVLMRLGLMYLRDHGDRTAIHKATLLDKPLREEIKKVRYVERDNGFIFVWTELHK